MASLKPWELITDLEARQDELIQQLDCLNDRIEAALAELAPPPQEPQTRIEKG